MAALGAPQRGRWQCSLSPMMLVLNGTGSRAGLQRRYIQWQCCQCSGSTRAGREDSIRVDRGEAEITS
jgi:hypothetical protein